MTIGDDQRQLQFQREYLNSWRSPLENLTGLLDKLSELENAGHETLRKAYGVRRERSSIEHYHRNALAEQASIAGELVTAKSCPAKVVPRGRIVVVREPDGTRAMLKKRLRDVTRRVDDLKDDYRGLTNALKSLDEEIKRADRDCDELLRCLRDIARQSSNRREIEAAIIDRCGGMNVERAQYLKTYGDEGKRTYQFAPTMTTNRPFTTTMVQQETPPSRFAGGQSMYELFRMLNDRDLR